MESPSIHWQDSEGETTENVRMRTAPSISAPEPEPPVASTSAIPPPPPRRVIKIKPRDYPHLEFNGKDVRLFLRRYEAAGEIEGAEGYDLAIQILSFIKGKEILELVEEMEGYEGRNWPLLKKQMLATWEKTAPAPRYTIKDLDSLVDSWQKVGGVDTRIDYQKFIVDFEQVANYLLKNHHIRHEEILVEPFFKALSTQLQHEVKKRLIKAKKMRESLDHSYLLPELPIIREHVEKEMQFRIPFSFQEKSNNLLEASNKELMKQLEGRRKTAKVRSTSPNDLEKKIEDLAKQLEAFKAQDRRKPEFKPQERGGPKKCWYCHIPGHTSWTCRAAEEDLKSGKIKKEGTKLLFLDGRPLPFDPAVPQRDKVLAQGTPQPVASTSTLEDVKTQCGILSWDPPQLSHASFQKYQADLGKRGRKPKAKEDSRKKTLVDEERVEEDEDDYESDEMVESRPIRRMPALGSHGKGKTVEGTSEEGSTQKTGHPVFEELTAEEKAWLERARTRKKKLQEEGPKPKPVYHRPATKNHPDALDRLLERIFDETTVPVKLGELAAVAPHLAEGLKKWSTKKRVHQGTQEEEMEEAQAHSVRFEEEAIRELKNPLYSCPLGFVEATINGHPIRPLVDSGSQINIISTSDAQKWGLSFKQHQAKLGGIGGHSTELVGIAEDVEVQVADICSKTHFFVADGPVTPLLGRPFLFGREAKLNYVKGKGEIMALKGRGGDYTIIPICSVYEDTWFDEIPKYVGHHGWVDVDTLIRYWPSVCPLDEAD